MGFAVGKVIGSGAEGVAELESVAVDGGGAAEWVWAGLCVRRWLEWCRGQGAGAVELEVRAGSEGAIALYAGLGFVVVGAARGYYREPVEDAVLMRLELAEVASNPHCRFLRACDSVFAIQWMSFVAGGTSHVQTAKLRASQDRNPSFHSTT